MPSLFETRQLEIFRLLARHRSFTQAAICANISQSAVSHTIQALERQVACRLLDRSSRRVSLTPAGEQFLHHVNRILDEMASAATGLQRLKSWGQIQLRIAAHSTLCETLLPGCLHEIRLRYPTCSIALEAVDRNGAISQLLDGHVDLAISPGAEPDERFEHQAMFADELVFVMLPSHPWALGLPTEPADLAAEPVISFPRGSYSWNLILHHLRPDHIEPTVLIECNNASAIRSMVLLGMGVGILARWMVSREAARGDVVCHTLGRRPLIRRWGALSLRAKRLALPQILLIEQIRKTALAQFEDILPANPSPAYPPGEGTTENGRDPTDPPSLAEIPTLPSRTSPETLSIRIP